jgi:hypothetical protein
LEDTTQWDTVNLIHLFCNNRYYQFNSSILINLIQIVNLSKPISINVVAGVWDVILFAALFNIWSVLFFGISIFAAKQIYHEKDIIIQLFVGVIMSIYIVGVSSDDLFPICRRNYTNHLNWTLLCVSWWYMLGSPICLHSFRYNSVEAKT